MSSGAGCPIAGVGKSRLCGARGAAYPEAGFRGPGGRARQPGFAAVSVPKLDTRV